MILIFEETFHVKHVNKKNAINKALAEIQKEEIKGYENLLHRNKYRIAEHIDRNNIKSEVFYTGDQQNIKSLIWKKDSHEGLKDSLENLFDSGIEILDTDNLDFCLPYDENIFWFCSLNKEHLEEHKPAKKLIEEYSSDINMLLSDLKEYEVLRNTLLKDYLWNTAIIDIRNLKFKEVNEAFAHLEPEPDFDENIGAKESNLLLCYGHFLIPIG